MLTSDPDIGRAVADDWCSDVLKIAVSILRGERGALSSLLDHAIDCDKIDYVGRDSLHCGITLSGGFDHEQLLRSLCTVEGGQQIAIREEGIAAAEALMVAQNTMLSRVYWRAETRAVICMIHAALAHIIRSDKDKLRGVARQLKGAGSDHAGIETALMNGIQQYSPKTKQSDEDVAAIRKSLESLVRLLLVPQYTDIYRQVSEYSRSSARTTDGIYERVVPDAGKLPSMIPVDWSIVGILRSAFCDVLKQAGLEAGDLDVLVDAPYGKTTHRVVKVMRKHSRKIENLTAISHLKGAIFEAPALHLSPVRVFLRPSLFNSAHDDIADLARQAEQAFRSNTRD